MKKRMISLLLALVLVVTLLPTSVFAANTEYGERVYGSFGSYTVNSGSSITMNHTDDLKALLDLLADSSSSTVVVNMGCNWDLIFNHHWHDDGWIWSDWKYDEYNGSIIISGGKTVTFNMNGYVIDRKNPYETNGSAFVVNSNATLTLQGSNKHYISYSYTTESKGSSTSSVYSGGLVTGGYSTIDAGGILMEAGSKVYLKSVAVAGNRIDKRAIGTYGKGGGVRMNGNTCKLYLDDAIIENNYAESNGGGVYVEENMSNCYVKLENSSSISYNYSGGSGGGISVMGSGFDLYMYTSSKMNYNKAGTDGGGIYLNSSDGYIYMSSSQINNNRAEGGVGGGVDMCSADCALYMGNGCHINSNTASSNGGGVYVSSGSGCWIKTYGSSNSSINTISYNTSGGYGGGVAAQSANFSLDMRYSQINNNTSSDDGGAVNVMNASAAKITMLNSWMNSNTSSGDGGGVVLNSEGGSLTMDNSHINSNHANSGTGGGVSLLQKTITLKMKNNSTIDSNTATSDGGGVYTNADEIVVKGDGTTSISSNSSGRDGGGVYLGKETCSVGSMSILNNTASDQGGGVYDNNDDNSLGECTITGNTSTNEGGGVFVSSMVNIALSGVMTVKNNNSTGTTKENLYLHSSAGGVAYMDLSVDTRSEIGFSVGNEGNNRKLSTAAGTYADFNYIYDTNSYHAKWYNDDPSDSKYRYLYLVSGGGSEITTPTPVAAYTETVVGDGGYTTGGSTYEKKTIYFTYTPMTNSVEDYNAVCYYSDGYFFEDPKLYNEHLATMSAALMTTGYYTNRGTVGSKYYVGTTEYTYDADTYYNKHASLRQMLADIGCADDTIHVNEFSTIKPSQDSVGVGMAYKRLQYWVSPSNTYVNTDYILMPVSIRGAGYEAEWTSNVTVGPSGEHMGFAMAANMVYSEILDYIDAHDEVKTAAENGKLILWVTGYSRSGATANLTAKRIIAHQSPAINGWPTTNTALTNQARALEGRSDSYTDIQLFCYTFEAPQGGTDAAQSATGKADSAFYCIHNVLNKVDIVPYVAPTEMGFKRYGVDHYAPGSEAYDNTKGTNETYDNFYVNSSSYKLSKKTITVSRGASGDTTVTTWRDNDYYAVGSTGYNKLRAAAIEHMDAVNPYMVFDDYFSAATIKYVQSNLPLFGSDLIATSTSTITPEQFIEEFFAKLQEWGISGRPWFTTQTLTLNGTNYGKTFQQALRDAFEIVYSQSTSELDDLSGALGKIKSNIGMTDLYDLYFNILRGWNNLTEAEKKEKIDWVWSDLLEPSGLLDYYTTAEKNMLKADWPTLANPLLSILSSDYHYQHPNVSSNNGQIYIGTLVYNVSRILNNHFAETLFGWLRADDSYYTMKSGTTWTATETTRYAITRPTSVAKPTGYALSTEADLTVDLGNGGSYDLYGTNTLYFDNKNIGGEAIYYWVIEQPAGGGLPTEQNQLYENGLTLTTEGDYLIDVYAMSYGVQSSIGVYDIHIGHPQEYTLDEQEPTFIYTSGWTTDTSADHYEGTAKKLTVTSSNKNFDYSQNVEFTFTGTGFRLYTDTSCKSGMVMVSVSYDDNGTTYTDKRYISLYRGFTGYTVQNEGTANETIEWTPVSSIDDYEDTLYRQVPAISMDLGTSRTYTVKIAPYYTSLTDKLNLGYMEFSLDSVTFVDLPSHETTYSYTNLREAVVEAGNNATLSSLTLEGPYVYINTANMPTGWFDNNAVTRVYFYYKYNNNADTAEAWSTTLIPTDTENVYAVRKPQIAANTEGENDAGDPMGSRWTHMVIVRSKESAALGWSGNSCLGQTIDIDLSSGNYISSIGSEIGTQGDGNGKYYNLTQTSLNVVDDGYFYFDLSRFSWWNNSTPRTSVCFQEFNSNNQYVTETWATAELVDSSVYGNYFYRVEIPDGNWTKLFIFRFDSNVSDGWSGYWNRTAQVLLTDGLNIASIRSDVDGEGFYLSSRAAFASSTLAGGVMLDGSSETITDVKTLKENGPKNLLYLAPSSALIFTVSGNNNGAIASGNCGIGVKALQGTGGKLAVYALDDSSKTLTLLKKDNVNSYTESYKTLNSGVNLQGKTVVLYNDGSDPIALSQIRVSGLSANLSLRFSAPVVMRSIRILRQVQAGELEPIETEEPSYFTGHSLSLDGDIGVNFYVDPCGLDVGNLTVKLSGPSGSDSVALSWLEPQENGSYKLTARVAAKEMTDAVTATLWQGDSVLASDSFSVADYANRILANQNGEFDALFAEEGKLERLQALCRAMLLYGAKAQDLFTYRQDAPADAALADRSLTALSAIELANLGENDVPDLSAFGLVFYGSSLILETKTTYRLYFTVTDAEKLAGLTVYCGDTALGRGKKDDLVYYDLEDIPADAILENFALRFELLPVGSYTECSTGSFTAGSYLFDAVQGSGEILAQTATALYRYCLAAEDYFG